MNEDLTRFLIYYNLYIKHGSLRRELKVKTPFNAIEKQFEISLREINLIFTDIT